MSPILRVGIVGCGNIAEEHMNAWRKIPNSEVVIACDKNEDAARSFSERWSINRHGTIEKTKMNGISAIDICTPPLAHKGLAIEALESGHHVLLEKPLAFTLDDAEAIISAKEESGKVLGVIHNWLYEPKMREIMSKINDGKIGNVLSAEICALHPANDPMISNEEHWCHSLPGGRIGEILPHPIYILHSILGRLKVDYVGAEKSGPWPWVKKDELRVIVRGPRGKLGSIYITFNSSRRAVLVSVYGTEASLMADLVSQSSVLLGPSSLGRTGKALDCLGQAGQILSSLTKLASKALIGRLTTGQEICIRSFAEAVMGREKPVVSIEEALENVRILEEITGRI